MPAEHLGYDRGDAEADLFENSRDGLRVKTVSTEVGAVEVALPRDRNPTCRLDGLDGMIISL